MKNKHANTTLERHVLEANPVLRRKPRWAQKYSSPSSVNCMGYTCSYISIWGNCIYTAVRSDPAIQEPSYTHEQLNSKNAVERGWGEKTKQEDLKGVEEGVLLCGLGLEQESEGCYSSGRAVALGWFCCWQVSSPAAAAAEGKWPLSCALGRRTRVSLLQKQKCMVTQWLARRARRAAGSIYEHHSAVRGWHESSNCHNKRDHFLHLSLSVSP